MFKILDRYIYKKLLMVLLFVVVSTVSIIELIHFVNYGDFYVGNNITHQEVAKYYFSYLPFLINFILPVACFVTTVFVTLDMSRKSEIIASFSSGIKFTRFIRPYIIGAIITGLFSYWLVAYCIPYANRYKINFDIKYLGRVQHKNLRNIHVKVGKDKYVYVRTYNNYINEGELFTYEEIDNKLTKKLSADMIKYSGEKGYWIAKNWNLRKIKGEDEVLTSGDSLKLKIDLEPADFSDDFSIREMLNMRELDDYISKLKKKNSDTLYLFLIEKYIRYMYPVSLMLLVLAGILFSSKTMRRGMGFQIMTSFVLALAYVMFFMLSKGRAEAHTDSLLLTIWMPNIVFAIVVGILYRIMPK